MDDGRLFKKQRGDVDAEDSNDVLFVSDYVHDIMDYLFNMEVSRKPDPLMFDKHKWITPIFRADMVEKLIVYSRTFKCK